MSLLFGFHSVLLAAVVTSAVEGAEVIKIGGYLKAEYSSAFQKWVDWANSATNGYTVNIEHISSSSMDAGVVTKMTTPGDATLVDALICPYGSTSVKACVLAVNEGFTGPVFAWGGASDDIFASTHCGKLPNKNCFGFFTVGSKYMEAGLMKLNSLDWSTMLDGTRTTAHVATIVNNNGFSKSVITGANATVNSQAKLTQASYVQLADQKNGLTATDVTNVDAALAMKPDIVAIGGHNLDVEPVIVHIGKHSHRPKAIIATNGLTKPENYGTDSKYASCVMMPTQWDETSSSKDAVVGWSVADFKTAMGGSATYQQAGIAAVGVAIANAMATNNAKENLVATLALMDTQSFYGRLNWDTSGRIQKPMFTVQKQGDANVLVAPTGNIRAPLSLATCWGNSSTAGTASGVATSKAFSKAFSAWIVFGMILAQLWK
jgi:hypothetical protein